MIIKELKTVSKVKRKAKDIARLPSTTNEKGNILKHFGCNPKEEDGLNYQKKVRKEWD